MLSKITKRSILILVVFDFFVASWFG